MASIISAGTTSGTSLNLSGDTSGVLQLATNGSTTAITVDTSQNVGIGTTVPSSSAGKLVVSGVANVYGDERKILNLIDTTALATGVGAGISFWGTSESGGGTSQFGSIKGVKENATSANYAGALAFVTSNSSNVQREQVRITSGGDLFIKNNSNLQWSEYSAGTSGVIWTGHGTNNTLDAYTTGTLRMRINNNGNIVLQGGTLAANGVGITFPATQSASSDANCLDDYEEGTWTPTIFGSTTAGTATYSSNAARYTKIGRLVFVETYITWSGGTGAGDLRLGGLPFTAANVDVFPGLVISYFENVAMTANNFPMFYISKNQTAGVFVQCPTGGGVNNNIPYDAAGAIQVSGCYTV